LYSFDLGYGPVVDSCVHADEILDFIIGGKLIDLLRDFWLLKKGSDSWSFMVILYNT
jgi:hypothetical protein